eukprot:SM000054S18110  [mRNA]  locus=s54:497142:499348:+ [translate_table: standard]
MWHPPSGLPVGRAATPCTCTTLACGSPAAAAAASAAAAAAAVPSGSPVTATLLTACLRVRCRAPGSRRSCDRAAQPGLRGRLVDQPPSAVSEAQARRGTYTVEDAQSLSSRPFKAVMRIRGLWTIVILLLSSFSTFASAYPDGVLQSTQRIKTGAKHHASFPPPPSKHKSTTRKVTPPHASQGASSSKKSPPPSTKRVPPAGRKYGRCPMDESQAKVIVDKLLQVCVKRSTKSLCCKWQALVTKAFPASQNLDAKDAAACLQLPSFQTLYQLELKGTVTITNCN